MAGKICYIDCNNLTIIAPGTYTSYMDYYKSAKEADFIVVTNVYSDTSRTVKVADSIVLNIIDKKHSGVTPNEVLCAAVGMNAQREMMKFQVIIAKRETGSEIQFGVYG